MVPDVTDEETADPEDGEEVTPVTTEISY